MKKINFFERSIVRVLFLFLVLISINFSLKSQNVVITDDDGYSADPSAMLDVKSVDKGMLIPRLSTTQRTNIASPATGLMVYDTDFGSFFYFDGYKWLALPQLSTSVADGQALFAVLNSSGDTVFAVYNDGVKIYVNEGAKGTVGGFAVSGRNPAKATIEESYFKVTPDSTRIWVNESAKGTVGGFAVSGRNPAKGTILNYFVSTIDSTRVYINDTSTTKGTVGGFAVSGRNPAKGFNNEYFVTTPDSTRVYVNEGAKGTVGGFAVSGRNPAKGTTGKFMDITPENYLIGQLAGENLTSGLYNTFMGYYAGRYYTTGSYNTFLGYKAGLSLINFKGTGNNNVAMGYQAGSNLRTGRDNVFIGTQAGDSTTTGYENTFIGYQAGMSNTTGYHGVAIGYNAGKALTTNERNTMVGGYSGEYLSSGKANAFFGTYSGRETTSGGYNTFIGYDCGISNTTGRYNTYVGFMAGRNAESDSSVLIGARAGYGLETDERLYIENSSSNSPLIYGEFDNDILVFNANSVTISKDFPILNIETSEIISTDAVLKITGARTTSETAEIARIEFWNKDNGNAFELARILTRNSDAISGTTKGELLFKVNDGTGLTQGMIIDYTGYVGLNVSTPNYQLEVNGDAAKPGGGTWTNSSDIRLKDIHGNYEKGLEAILELNPVLFNYKQDNPRELPSEEEYIGFIAQDVRDIFPEAISEGRDGYLDFNMHSVNVALVNAVKDQQKIIEELKKENEEFKNRLTQIEKLLLTK